MAGMERGAVSNFVVCKQKEKVIFSGDPLLHQVQKSDLNILK